jgi:hypothetical protein
VEVERGIPTGVTCSRASRLEQRCGKRPRGAEPTASELQETRVDLPGDVDGEPSARPGGGEPGYCVIQATSSLIRIHVAQLRSAGHGGIGTIGDNREQQAFGVS